MKDCTEKLHAILRSPKELARAFGDFAQAWGCNIAADAGKAPGGAVLAADESLRPVGELTKRLRPNARRVITVTAQNWGVR